MIKKLLIVSLFLMILPFVSAAGNLTVTPPTNSITANVNQFVSGVVTITNNDGVNDLSVPLPSPIDFIGPTNNENILILYNESNPLIIANGSSVDVNYSFTVPSNAFAEQYLGVFNFTTSEQAESYDDHTFSLTVYPNPILTVTDADATWVRGVDNNIQTNITVNNVGNNDLTNVVFTIGNLFLSDGTQLTETITDPSQITLSYGTAQDVTITITGIPSTQAIGTYTGNITTTYGSNKTISTLTINVVDPVYNIDKRNINFGTVDQNQTVTTTFNIENTGNAKLTGVYLSSANIDSKYNVTFNQTTPFNLDVNQIKTIPISFYIPENEKTGEHSIGSIDVISNEYNFTSAYSLYVNIEKKLIIDRIDAYINKDIDGNSVSDRINDDGDTIDEKILILMIL